MTGFDVDFFVIGAGSGGTRAARIAASHGARVMVAEEFRIGGTCVIRGCVPKKLYVYASRFADDFEDAAGFGWHVEGASFDWPKLVAAKEQEISRLSGIYRANLLKAGVEIIESRATILGPHEVQLAQDGRKISARHILVATGAAPDFGLDCTGHELAITSNEIFDLPQLPARLLIIGGGYIAVEFASLMARLGSKVTLVFRADAVLRGFDDDLRVGLTEAMLAAGIELRAGRLPQSLQRTGGGIGANFSDGSMAEFDQVLLATGRRPQTHGLGLETCGISLGRNGRIPVDAHGATSCPSVHAVGDVTDRINLTPVAIREGHVLADHLFGASSIAVDHHLVPSAVFTTPEIGTVGLGEAAARAMHPDLDIYVAAFRPMRATLSGRAEKTVLKLVVVAQSQLVLGLHVLGADAGEMAQLVAIAMKMRATKADFDATMALHPTAAEELVTMRQPTRRYRQSQLV
ncbi:MAG: glutathione-disulfide reductase [Hyphomicrobiales bacterium]|nr:glutathione-disulfide reductase [Hyphomicrobiales bacterium]